MLLCHVDGIGDVRLGDVAKVTVVDNAGETYAKVNGQDAIVLSIFKASTAGTSDVSKTCNKAIADLEKEYDGLDFTMLSDQGDYIKQFIDNIFSVQPARQDQARTSPPCRSGQTANRRPAARQHHEI